MKNTVIEKRMISMKNLKTLSERKKTFLWPKKTADKGKKEKKKEEIYKYKEKSMKENIMEKRILRRIEWVTKKYLKKRERDLEK